MTARSITMVSVCEGGEGGYLRSFLKRKSQSYRRLRQATYPHHPSPQTSPAMVRATVVVIVTVVGVVVIVVVVVGVIIVAVVEIGGVFTTCCRTSGLSRQ